MSDAREDEVSTEEELPPFDERFVWREGDVEWDGE